MICKSNKSWSRLSFTLIAASAAMICVAGGSAWLFAAPVSPVVFEDEFNKAKKDAEVVAEVRVLSAVCTDVAKDGNTVRSVTLQLALQIAKVEKGSVKENQIVTVSRKVNLPSGPGPGTYGYMAALHQFPFTPGVKGSVALRWDKDARAYVAVSGWVQDPNNEDIPKEVGKAISAKDAP